MSSTNNNNIRNSFEDDMVGINNDIEEGGVITSPQPSSNNISSAEICGCGAGGSPHDYDAAADQPPSPTPTIAAATSPTAAAVGASAAQSHTVEIMDNDDRDGMPLSPGMAEEISYAAEPKEMRRIEVIDDDNDAPVPPAMLKYSHGSDNDDDIDIHYVDEQRGPPQFGVAEHYEDEDAIAKQSAKEGRTNQKTAAATVTTSDREPMIEEVNQIPAEQQPGIGSFHDTVPTIEDMERDERQAGIHYRGINRIGWEDIDVETLNNEEEGGIDTYELGTTPQGDDNDTTIHIPEAFLVEEREEAEVFLIEERDDGTVYDASPLEPTPPWWKQRRMRVLLGVAFVLLAAMAIALGVTLSSNNNNENNPVVQNVLILPSDAPSSSLVPTSSPTTCVHKIIENAQAIDLQKDLQIDSPYRPKVVVDGRNMVVVALDEKYINKDDAEGDDDYYINYGGEDYIGPVFITFYSLDDDDKWQRIQTKSLENIGGWYDVVLSGTTSFVGFPYANNDQGIVLVYEQNQFGEWEKVEDPFHNATQSTFGLSVEVEGDLACVLEQGERVIGNMNLYHHEGSNKWVQFETVAEGYRCSISGDTIAIAIYDWVAGFQLNIQLYQYNQDLKKVTPIQDPITTGYIESMDLSNDYLVYWDYDSDADEGDAFTYSRNDKNQTFTLHQQLNITGSEYNSLALDNDLLVVGGTNRTHIFSLQNDEWVETITLDQVFNDYQLSGRTLIATSEENKVYSFNIQDCMQAMPTQTPSISLSVAPSLAPSSPPSLLPSSSISPSTSPSLSMVPSSSLEPSSSFSPTFSWQTLSWRQQGLAIAGDSADDKAGTSVAISGDGRTVAVGAPGKGPGYVKVFYKQFDLSFHVTFTGKKVGDRFGTSVSMSEDGKTLAIGAPGDLNDRPGYTRVYTRKNDKWVQLGDDIEGEAIGDQSGYSVSLSSDGKTVANGAYRNDGNDDNGDYWAGHVRVYTVDESDGDSSSTASWKQVGQDIDGEADFDESGFSVSLSANGRTVAIGAYGNNGGGNGEYWDGFKSGHVRVYNLVGDDWEQIGQDIDGENEGDEFGTSVSLSSDGRMVAVGAPYNDDNGPGAGKVRVYRLASSDGDSKWVLIGQDLNGEAEYDSAGTSVSLSSDGKRLAIGADQYQYGSDEGSGYVRVYHLVGSDDSWSWVQVSEDIYGVNAGDHAGSSVALSSDGNLVAVGSPWNDDNGDSSGQVRVFGVDIEDATTPACVDTPNYLDMYGGTCAEYELPGNENWCGGYGNAGEAGKTPNKNCCICINALADDENNRL